MTDTGIAICYLSKENDENNKALLSETELRIVYEGRSDPFPLDQLSSLEFQTLKLWAPVVYGGIAAPLSVASIATGDFNQWLVLFVFCSGVLAFYYGWTGKRSLIVFGRNIKSQYQLNSISENLISFVDYVNGHLNNNHYLRYLYLPVDSQEDNDLQTSLPYHRCYTYLQSSTIVLKENQSLAVIDPLKVKAGVRYELDSASQVLEPRIYGSIDKEAVVEYRKTIY